MKTIMMMALVAFGGAVVAWADDAPTTPTPVTPAVSAPAPVASTPAVSTPAPVASTPATPLDKAIEKAKTDAANAVEAKVAVAVAAAVTPPVPQRTWSGFAYDCGATTVGAVRYGACQVGRGVTNLDGAAAAIPGEVGTYVARAAFDAAAACDAASK